MLTPQRVATGWEAADLDRFGARLRAFNLTELEDIYFHIDILRCPLRYRLLRMEMERRHVRAAPPPPPVKPPDLRRWADARALLRRHNMLRETTLALLFSSVSTVATLAMLAPIWLFAFPLHFLAPQTALIYLFCYPFAPIVGLQAARQTGARGVHGAFAVIGALLALWLFNRSGALREIVEMLFSAQPSGGAPFSF